MKRLPTNFIARVINLICKVIIPSLLGLILIFEIKSYEGAIDEYIRAIATTLTLLAIFVWRWSEQVSHMVCDQNYDKNPDGSVIKGGSYSKTMGSQDAIIFIPGFYQSSICERETGDYFYDKLKLDYHIFLPVHCLSDLNDQYYLKAEKIERETYDFIYNLLSKYKRIYLIGYSMGGVIALNFGRHNRDNPNIIPIAVAPSFFVGASKQLNQLSILFCLIFSNYSNHWWLEQKYPSFYSTDEVSTKIMLFEKLYYFSSVISILELSMFDKKYRNTLKRYSRKAYIYYADNENRIDTKLVNEEVKNNPNIEFKYYKGGKHRFWVGTQRDEFRKDFTAVVKEYRARDKEPSLENAPESKPPEVLVN